MLCNRELSSAGGKVPVYQEFPSGLPNSTYPWTNTLIPSYHYIPIPGQVEVTIEVAPSNLIQELKLHMITLDSSYELPIPSELVMRDSDNEKFPLDT